MGTLGCRPFDRMGLLVLLVSTLLQLCPSVLGHGNMVFPFAWWDVHQAGSFWDEKGRETEMGCGVLDLPDNEFEHSNGHFQADCLMYWFSNKVEIPGLAVLPEYMSQPETTCIHQAGANDHGKKFPWHAPGTAPIFGSCGTLGGHCGDHHDGHGDLETAVVITVTVLQMERTLRSMIGPILL